MVPWGPFGTERQVVAAVSGGADSMALALLLRGWGRPLAVVVDHALRPESEAEAALTLARLERLGIPARLVSLKGRLHGGADLGARARMARYAALLEVCCAEGLPDLLTGHHAQDQVETQVLRARAGSGGDGLAGMAAVTWWNAARIVRPFLAVAPARLRATLLAAGVAWVEDPTNHAPGTARGGLRSGGLSLTAPPDEAIGTPELRRRNEAELARVLARCVTMHPSGHAEIRGALPPAGWSALLWTLSGREYPPPREGVRRLAATGSGTLHGVRVQSGLAVREAAAMGPGVPAHAGSLWDGRFRLGREVAGGELGALGMDAARVRRRPGLPSVVLRTLPALRMGGKLFAVPHLAYPDGETCRTVQIDFVPTRPLAGLPFIPG